MSLSCAIRVFNCVSLVVALAIPVPTALNFGCAARTQTPIDKPVVAIDFADMQEQQENAKSSTTDQQNNCLIVHVERPDLAGPKLHFRRFRPVDVAVTPPGRSDFALYLALSALPIGVLDVIHKITIIAAKQD